MSSHVLLNLFNKTHVLLNLFNKLGKSDKVGGFPSILSLFHNDQTRLLQGCMAIC